MRRSSHRQGLRRAVRIDLLLTDVGFPIMNGRQLAEFARELRPEIKVLFVTGYAENAAVRGGFLDHGMDMLTKPLNANSTASPACRNWSRTAARRGFSEP